jgi:diguanylate cyclase (GGDEF)-like protein
LNFFSRAYRRIFRAVFRPTTIPAAIAAIVILCAAVFAESQNREISRQQLRTDVLGQVGLIRAKLEGTINGNIQLVRGLVATLSTEPSMDQERFAALSANLLGKKSQIRNIAGAPDFVVSLMYPLKGNEKAIGLDYRINAQQRAAALRARDTGGLVLAGPVDLVQGGQGLIGRFPVFTEGDAGQERFWGIVSAVVDVGRLYRESGLLDPKLPIDVAISGKDGLQDDRTIFYGDPAVVGNDPVMAEVVLPSGSWHIAAVPKGGWNVPPANLWLLRAIMGACGALIIIPILITGGLIEERQKNIRELRRREAELERLSRRLGLALDASSVGVWEYDITSDRLVWDERMDELYGLPADGKERGYADWKGAIHPDDLERAEADFARSTSTGAPYNSDYRLRLPDGALRHIRAIGAVYGDADGARRIVGANWDVSADVALNDDLRRAKSLTEARNAELLVAKARIEHTALHDSLTGLPNRRYLDEKLEIRASLRGEEKRRTALLHIDLDRFKQINDTLGHAAGDAMLVHAAKILKKNVRATDFLARVGGDEFVVMCLLEGSGSDEDAKYLAGLADRVIRQMRRPVLFEGHECRFGVSVGIATESDPTADPRKLLVNADIALYRAKSRGRNRYQFFNDALQAEIVSTKRMADEILSGIEQKQFVAYYQPQFDAQTLEVTGVEALVRWNHPTDGVLAPGAFLGIAEELNVVSTIDRMILEQGLEDFRKWREAGLNIPKFSVNVSARRLNDEELIRSLRRLDIEPGTVSFELVESIFLDDNDAYIGWNVEQIKELGIDIEIDDFGTGYASIVSLLKLKPRRLKIDRQLVMPITQSRAQRNLVESIVEIGKSLGIEVIAEGVETMEHAAMLKSLGCHGLQGYAFAQALKSDELKSFVQSRRWREAS